MDVAMYNYLPIVKKHEDLKSQERFLNTALANIGVIKTILIDKEKEFCLQDQDLRSSSVGSVKDALRKRCTNLIDHFMHYKCLLDSLTGDTMDMANSLDDDEFVHLSLTSREVVLAMVQAIRTNKIRDSTFSMWHEEEARTELSNVESQWRKEHEERRKQLSKLILDQKQVVVSKLTANLEQQREVLNQRYQLINDMIKMSNK